MRIQQELARDVVVAIESNLFELYATLGRMPKAWVESSPDILRVKTGLPHEALNGIFRARIPEDRAEDAIRAALGDFMPDRVPLQWWVGPSSEPARLGAYLERCGMVRTGELGGMAIDLEALDVVPSMPWELSIRPVRDEPGIREWLRPFAAQFGMPEPATLSLFDFLKTHALGSVPLFRLYVGRWAGRPVATMTLFFGAGVAGVYTTVLREHRKLGIGAAMSMVALRAARASGYRVGISHVPEDRLGFHRKVGFKEYFRAATYVPRAFVRERRTVESDAE